MKELPRKRKEKLKNNLFLLSQISITIVVLTIK